MKSRGMTPVTHFDRGWSGHKAAVCGSRVSELGVNVTRNPRLVDCERCRVILEWHSILPSANPADRSATVAEGETSLPSWMVPLWDAINEYAAACGADTSKRVYGNTRRQSAVAKVDNIVRGVAASDSTRLARLEKLLREIVEATRRHLEASLEVASLIPEQDTDWPDGYDFAALERARAEDAEASERLDSAIEAARKEL